MTINLDLLRPDDLLSLHIEGDNIRLDTSQPHKPALVLDQPRRPGFLIVTFPPQTVVEEAVFESSPTPAPSTRNKMRVAPFQANAVAPANTATPARLQR